MNRKILTWLSPFLALAIFLVALWTLKKVLGRYRFSEILGELDRLPPEAIVAALVLSIGSYLLLTFYDQLALRYLGRRLPVARVTLASFTSYAFSHNVGFALLTGGSIRYRMYSSWGLAAEEIARLTAFAALSFMLGLATAAGLLLTFSPADLPHIPYLPLQTLWPFGAVGLAMGCGYLLLIQFRKQPLHLRGWQLPLPSFRQGLGQIILGTTEWALTASVLYPLLPPEAGLSLPQFLQIYLLAHLVALFSHVPGGLGVFESVILLLVPNVPPPALFGSLLVFRGIYYLLPFGLAILLLAAFEIVQQAKRVRRAGVVFGQWIAIAGPALLSVGALGAGGALLFSAVLLPDAVRLQQWAFWLPRPLLEAGHFFSALVGASLLLLARGLQVRLRSAWRSAALLLPAGILLSLGSGSGIWPLAISGVVLAALLPGRALFHRRLSLLDEPFTPWWVNLILIINFTAIWLSLFSLQEVGFNPMAEMADYSAEATRILRAEIGSAAVFLLFIAGKRLRRSALLSKPADAQDIARAATLAEKDRSSFAHLALLGDKHLLFSTEGDSFLMYAEGASSLISLGDAVGATAQRQELAWRFREICERHGKWPVFFGIGTESSPLCLEMGLALQPIGSEGTLPLFEFSLAQLQAGQRDNYRALQCSGCVGEIVAAAEVARLLPELACIADHWRTAHGKEDHGFLHGDFNSEQIARFPLATVRRDGSLLAFVSLPPANGGADLILGLGRFLPDAPKGLFAFLVVEICSWAQQAGFSWLNLGLVPPLGGKDDLLAAFWQRFGPHIFPHGEHFADLHELRAFKESFRPHWHPRYLACPEALALPEILADIAGVGKGKATLRSRV